MSNPTEMALPADAADALSGTTDARTGAAYNRIGQSSYYTAAYRKEAIWSRILALANELRVVKDGELTYGVWGGQWSDGPAARSYAGSSGNALADSAANYIYLDADGTLQRNTTGFPGGVSHLPLATIVTAGGTYGHEDIADCRGRADRQAVGARHAVEADTHAAASPNALTANESGKTLTNEGASARNCHLLPPAAAGLAFTFVVQDSDGLRVSAGAGDTIRIAGAVTPAGGYVECAAVGSVAVLAAINATEWVALGVVGAWTVSA